MVIFDLFNEPILDASDRFGNVASGSLGMLAERLQTSKGPTAGMQQMLNAVRGRVRRSRRAGGIDWAHKLDQWLQQKPQPIRWAN